MIALRPPRSVRARLVVGCVLAAILIGAISALVLTLSLESGLATSLDAALAARSADQIADLPPDVDAAATVKVTSGARDVGAFAIVLRSDGSIASAEPAKLPRPLLDVVHALGTAARSTYVNIAGVEMRARVEPVSQAGASWTVVVGIDSGQAEDAIDDVQIALAVAGPVLLVAVAFGAWVVSGSALRPVTRLRRDAAAIGTNDAAGRLSVPDTRDEIAELATTFNELLDRLHRSLIRQRDLVADAGHELRTPLAVLRTELELADRAGRTVEELADAVTHARVEVERLSRLADDMLFLAHADDGSLRLQREAVDCDELLHAATRALRATAAQAGVRLDVRSPSPLTVWADPVVLRRAVDNLLTNAVRACDGGGVVVASAAVDGDTVVLTVADDGPGFDERLLPRAFDRFTTGASARSSGSGLGLAITLEIASAHGGTASARNATAGGAEVSVRIPRAAAALAPELEGTPA